MANTRGVSGDEFKRLRGRLKLTQEQLARRLGVTTSAVSRWEAGRRRIPEPVGRLLALTVELDTKQAPRGRGRYHHGMHPEAARAVRRGLPRRFRPARVRDVRHPAGPPAASCGSSMRSYAPSWPRRCATRSSPSIPPAGWGTSYAW